MQLWITQVSIITIAIAFISFIAVLTARKIEDKEGGRKTWQSHLVDYIQ